jgi:hypothetical protein
MSAVELRPYVPEMGDTPVVPDPRPWIERSRLIVDRQAGTAVWLADTRKQERVELRLGDAPGELAAVVRVIYPPLFPNAWFPRLNGRLFLVDCDGRVLARSLSLPQTLFEQMWPFDLLDRAGLPMREERFRNTRLMHAALPGSAPPWPLTAGYGWFLLTVTAGLAVLFGLATLVVVVTGWG